MVVDLLEEEDGLDALIGLVEDALPIADAITLTGGVRVDRWQLADGRLDERTLAGVPLPTSAAPADRAGTEPTARIGLAVAATGALTLRGAAYLGFRVPTLNELYRPFRVGADATAANAALKPERLRGIEAGFDFRPLPGASLSATLFGNRVENAIGNVTLASGPGVFPGVGFVAGSFRQRLNLDAIDSVGIEVNGRLDIDRWSLSASYALTDAAVDASGLAAALDGRRPAETPRHQASAGIGYDAGGWSANVRLRYDGKRFEDDLGALPLAGALTVDAGARIAISDVFSLRMAGENLFDRFVEAGTSSDGIVDRAQPRTLWVGIDLRL